MAYMNENPIMINDQTIQGTFEFPKSNDIKSCIFSNCIISDIAVDGQSPMGKAIQNLTFHNCRIKNLSVARDITDCVIFEDSYVVNFSLTDSKVSNKFIILNSKLENITLKNTSVQEFQNIGSKYINAANDSKCFFRTMSLTKSIIADSTLYLDETHIQTLIVMNSLFQHVFSGDLNNSFKYPVIDLCTMDYRYPTLVFIVNRDNGTVYNGMLPKGQTLEEMYHGVMMDSMGMPFAEKSSAAKFVETILALNYLRSVRSLYLDTAKIQSVV